MTFYLLNYSKTIPGLFWEKILLKRDKPLKLQIKPETGISTFRTPYPAADPLIRIFTHFGFQLFTTAISVVLLLPLNDKTNLLYETDHC